MMSKREAGRMGGRATAAKYGREHMQKIGREGARVLWSRYFLHPWGPVHWALVRREDFGVVRTGLKR